MLSTVEGIREEADGFVLSFAVDPVLEKEVNLWIEGERRCCPFFNFEVDRAPNGVRSVCVTGPAGAKQILLG